LGHQTRQAAPFERRFRLIKSWAGDPKQRRDLDDRTTIHPVPAQHLVAHLQKVFGVEKGVLAEQGVGDSCRVRVEGAGAFEFEELLIGLLEFGHAMSQRYMCKYYYDHRQCLSTEN